jgi:SAM-dependent methyltransferase
MVEHGGPFSPQYARSEQLIVQHLDALGRARVAHAALLEVGPGSHSIVLGALERALARPPRVSVDFIEKSAVAEVRGGGRFTCDASAGAGAFDDGRIAWTFVRHDFNHACADEAGLLAPAKYDMVVMPNVLHELYRDHESSTPEMFFDRLFDRLARTLRPDGVLLVTDPYYPRYIPRIGDVFRTVFRITRHADPPVCFIHPEQILMYALRSEAYGAANASPFSLVLDETAYLPLPDSEYGRKSYIFILQRS